MQTENKKGVKRDHKKEKKRRNEGRKVGRRKEVAQTTGIPFIS